MKDPLRPEAKVAVQACQDAGIRTVMITGDHKDTAVAIAGRVGGVEGRQSLSGTELDRLSDDELVRPWRGDGLCEGLGGTCCVSSKPGRREAPSWPLTGDGVNDARSQKRRTSGWHGGDRNRCDERAADMVVTDDNFASSPRP
jgi:Ca2+-transporting ATPase